MDAAYLRAAMPEPCKILGVALHPFCMGHEILFQKVGNKFSLESKELPSISDLMTGVFICSQPYSKSVALEEFKIPIRWMLAKWILGASFFIAELNRFSSYIRIGSEIPDFYSKGDPKKTSVGSPTIQTVKVSLMANLGMNEEEALNVPFSLAFWNHLTWAEINDSIQIVDDAEREKQKRNAELMASSEAKLEAWARRVTSLSA